MEAEPLDRCSVAQYLALDSTSDRRWEYVDGRPLAMAGASLRHNAVVMNLSVALGAGLDDTPCFALGSDQKVEAVQTRSFFYPDLSIICGQPKVSDRDPNAIVNPQVIVEVASPNTSDYDRGAKFDHYATIESLREMVVVFTDSPRVEHRVRTDDGRWIVSHLVGGQLQLDSLDVSLSFEEIYRRLDRIEPATAPGQA